MSSLEPAASPAGDRQAGAQQADLSPPNLSSMLIINPTYSALPVSLHHKLTFLFFSLPSSPFSVLLCPFAFTPPSFSSPPSPVYSPSCSKVIHVKIIDDEEYEKNKNFFLELAEPRMVDMSLQKGAVLKLFSLVFSLTVSLFFALVLYLNFHSALCVCDACSPPASLYLYTAVQPSTLQLIAML